MPRGGKRPGAGKPPGPHQATIEKRIWLEEYRAAIAAELPALIKAQLDLSKGVYHMMGRNPDGTWARVTDPEIMLKVLNSGEQFYEIRAQNPDGRALADIFDRLMGKPAQAVTGEDGGPVEHVFRWQK
jgi:hypothetical protein